MHSLYKDLCVELRDIWTQIREMAYAKSKHVKVNDDKLWFKNNIQWKY